MGGASARDPVTKLPRPTLGAPLRAVTAPANRSARTSARQYEPIGCEMSDFDPKRI